MAHKSAILSDNLLKLNNLQGVVDPLSIVISRRAVLKIVDNEKKSV
jgi:hypothetical protein